MVFKHYWNGHRFNFGDTLVLTYSDNAVLYVPVTEKAFPLPDEVKYEQKCTPIDRAGHNDLYVPYFLDDNGDKFINYGFMGRKLFENILVNVHFRFMEVLPANTSVDFDVLSLEPVVYNEVQEGDTVVGLTYNDYIFTLTIDASGLHEIQNYGEIEMYVFNDSLSDYTPILGKFKEAVY